ncbi:hypothetical protein BOQ23_10315 [Listeria monocytogenes]|nr:hypothetical protein [Listeria monocytogenes]
MADKKYKLNLINHYDTSNKKFQKKEVKILKKQRGKLYDEFYPYQLCRIESMEYAKFMKWFEMEFRQMVKELWNQHFIVKLTLSQLYYRETVLFLEHVKEFSKRVTLEFIGEDIANNNLKSHFSNQEQEAFFIGKLRMLKKWKYTISKHIENCSVEQTLAFTPCIHEIKYSMNQEVKLKENVVDLHLFIDFWEYWATHKKLKFVIEVLKEDFITKSLMYKNKHIQFINIQ